MHFTIPETTERRDGGGSVFMTFEVHLNGVHHCSVRYSQLRYLHQQMNKEITSRGEGFAGRSSLPVFPPKKLMNLSFAQLEERRILLERYLQFVSQIPILQKGLAFNGFLLGAQQETWAEDEHSHDVDLYIYLMNDHKVCLRIRPALQTEDVLERTCRQLGLPEQLIFCFGLFLIHRDECGRITLVRKLQDRESPYISCKAYPTGGSSLKLILRKISWDPKIDNDLLAHKSSLNLLYVQTLSDVECGWVRASPEDRKQLASMQARGAKEEYMRMARSLPDYGYLHFSTCFCDYPTTNTKVDVVVGGRELILRATDKKGDLKEGRFRVTRMRCWRIMSVSNCVPRQTVLGGGNKLGDDHSHSSDPSYVCLSAISKALELSFEYLMPVTGEMQWISITSPQAILMSLCLQSMVEELLRMRGSGETLKGPNDPKTVIKQYCHKKMDGSEVLISIRCAEDPTSVTTRSNMVPFKKSGKSESDPISSRLYSVKSLSAKFEVVNMKEASRAAENILIENEAFQEVKDNDEELSTFSV